MKGQRRAVDFLTQYKTEESRLQTLISGKSASAAPAFERIIVPAERSGRSDVLLADLIAVASRVRGQVTGVLPVSSLVDSHSLAELWTARVRTFSGADSVPVLCASVTNGPDLGLLRYASVIEADLIGLPGVQYSSWRGGFLNRASRDIIAASRWPVWIAGALPALAGPAEQRCANVVCAVDLQPGSEAVVKYGDSLAQLLGAELSIAHVMPEINEGSLGLTLSDPDVVLSMPRARDLLSELGQTCIEPARCHLSRGPAGQELTRLAADLGPSLFVVGRRGCSNVGSTAMRLLRRTRYPMVMVPI
ncbi:MAG: universal stress protein [Bryobacteraceae bacterium]